MPEATVNDQSRLAGRTAIVTAAGRGIGRATAELYGREGARVVIASRSADGCSAAAEAIEAAGGTAIAKPADMGLKSDVAAVAGFAAETYGSLDILVNNAQSGGTRDHPAGLPVPAPLESFDDAELDWTSGTGFRGTFGAMQAAFPRMRERGGRIITFASMDGMIGNAGTVGDNITREAVRSLTRTAARERGRYAITVNVVAPTAKTDAADNIERADPEAMAAAVAAIPAGRPGDPHLDIAPAVLFLGTGGARCSTGQTLGVDGGLFPHARRGVRGEQRPYPAHNGKQPDKGGLRSMRLLGLDHIAIVVRDISETVARAGDTVDGRADGERLRGGDIDLQFLLFGETRLELIEVRAAGFGMPKLKDGETAVIGHLGYEVDDLEDAKAELTRRGVLLQGEFETGEVRSIFTAPETTFGVTLHLLEHKGRGTGA
jgi:NAD(P)-dependent dehydrogenase (short-subunit alcohol dehydrogenase family)